VTFRSGADVGLIGGGDFRVELEIELRLAGQVADGVGERHVVDDDDGTTSSGRAAGAGRRERRSGFVSGRGIGSGRHGFTRIDGHGGGRNGLGRRLLEGVAGSTGRQVPASARRARRGLGLERAQRVRRAADCSEAEWALFHPDRYRPMRWS